jgi:predicted deacylase
MAAVRLAKELSPRDVTGDLIIIHVQNVPGLQAKAGHICPLDGMNLGRAYPVAETEVEAAGMVSHQARSITHQICQSLFDRFISKADAFIDLHGGEHFETLPPNIEYLVTGDDETDEKTRALAESFGYEILWKVPQGTIPEMPGYPGRGSAVMEANMLGIPAVLCEVGGEGKIEIDLVDKTVAGVLSAMRFLGMIAGTPEKADMQTLVGGHVLFSKRAGLFVSRVKAGDEVAQGQFLGELINLEGDTVEEFHAPTHSRLTNVVTMGVANPGDMLFVMGNIQE